MLNRFKSAWNVLMNRPTVFNVDLDKPLGISKRNKRIFVVNSAISLGGDSKPFETYGGTTKTTY